MAWVPVHQAIGNHPKTKRLRRALGVSIPEAVGIVTLTQHWAIDYAPDGDLSEIDPADLEDGVFWEGDPGALFDAMQNAGFIDPDKRLHNWEKYGGKYIEERDRGRERKAKQRRKEADVRAATEPLEDVPWDDSEPPY